MVKWEELLKEEELNRLEYQAVKAAGENCENQKMAYLAVHYLQKGDTVIPIKEDKLIGEFPLNSDWIGDEKSGKPIVKLNESFVQINRIYHQESHLKSYVIKKRNSEEKKELSEHDLTFILGLFDNKNAEDSPQIQAVISAIRQSQILLTGGPGTGKTYTIVRMLAGMFQFTGLQKEEVVLAAPTGKAAARMSESIRDSLKELAVSDTMKEQFPDEGQTIHRLLGITDNAFSARFNQKNPLPYKVIVIDEASMIDINLMYALFQAIKSDTKLILAGDPNQLPSVEAGNVLADFCELAKREESSLKQVHLTFSHRFTDDGGIGRLAKEVNAGNSDAAFRCLNSDDSTQFIEMKSEKEFQKLISEELKEQLELLKHAKSPKEAFQYFKKKKILTALRVGKYGIEGIHKFLQNSYEANQITFKNGFPIMIKKNDYQLQVFNSDVGIILKNKEDNLRVYFEKGSEEFQDLNPYTLSNIEPAYAMTVHKSQGSEFDEVVLVLPETNEIDFVSRKLIYTAITRAKKKFTLIGSEKAFKDAVRNETKRLSGML